MSVESMFYKKPSDEEKIDAVMRYRKGEDIRLILDSLKITFMDLKGWNQTFDKEVRERLSPTRKVLITPPKEEARKSLDTVIAKHFPQPKVIEAVDTGFAPIIIPVETKVEIEPETLELEVVSAPSITPEVKDEIKMPKTKAKKKAASVSSRRKFSMEDKVAAVEKLLQGSSATSIAKEYDVHSNIVYKWKAVHGKAAQKNIDKRAKAAAKVPEPKAKEKRAYNKKSPALKADLAPLKVKKEKAVKAAPEFTSPVKTSKADDKDALIASLYQVIGNLTIENMRLKGQI